MRQSAAFTVPLCAVGQPGYVWHNVSYVGLCSIRRCCSNKNVCAHGTGDVGVWRITQLSRPIYLFDINKGLESAVNG